MNARFLEFYERELRHLRTMGTEFAAAFPKIAGRLDLGGFEIRDPYVERLLQGTAFLAARIQMKLDAEFPRFSHRLLEMLYPHYLAPTPAMLVAQFQPVLADANLAAGTAIVPRGTALRAASGRASGTKCVFSTAQPVTLWPIELVEASYFSFAADLPLSRLPLAERCKGGFRLKLRSTSGLRFAQTAIDCLRFHLGGADEAYRLHELLGTSVLGALCIAGGPRSESSYSFLPADRVQLTGFDDEQALLPVPARNFGGYRLLQEYFSLPQRYLFFDVAGLSEAVRANNSNELELVVLFSRGEAGLEKLVDASNFLLHCSPAINLFEKVIDRIHLTDSVHEFHVVPDRTRPTDFELYDLIKVVGYGTGADNEQVFRPFYADHHAADRQSQGYFSLRREPRLPSEKQQRAGTAGSGYIGSEVFLSLVDPNEAPYRTELRQLSLRARCTNRDLPLYMHLGGGKSDFSLEIAAPVEAIRCVQGPSKPYPAVVDGAQAWSFISQLSLNYLSLLDTSPDEGAAALRELLSLYATTADEGMHRQVEGLRSINCEQVVSRLPLVGPLCFGRGIRIGLEIDELCFEGGSVFLLGSVLERFLARHVSINSFTETVLRTVRRGEIMHWPARCGLRPIL